MAALILELALEIAIIVACIAWIVLLVKERRNEK